MSPTPPNKEGNLGNKDIKEENENEAIRDELTENMANNEEQRERRAIYIPLDQNAPYRDSDNGDDDEEEDKDGDSDSELDELDPDEHFAILASSRAFSKKDKASPLEPALIKYAHTFETDAFERKVALESEDIHLDDEKGKRINNLMQNFKLPDESIPTWAKLVPEDVWKKTLIDCLNAKKLDLFKNNS